MSPEGDTSAPDFKAGLYAHLQSARAADLEACRAFQTKAAAHVLLADLDGRPETVCGVDVSYSKTGTTAVATAVTLHTSDGAVIETKSCLFEPVFPYVPEFLAYREVLPLADLALGLATVPDVFFYDGNGTLHARRCGAACYFGLLVDRPTLGVSKNPVKGWPEQGRAGADSAETDIIVDTAALGLGAGVATRPGHKPIYVSVGHKITLMDAIGLARDVSLYRVPQPVRFADMESRRVLQQHEAQAASEMQAS